MRTVLVVLCGGVLAALLVIGTPVRGQQEASVPFKIDLHSVTDETKQEGGTRVLSVTVKFSITRQGQEANINPRDYKILVKELGREVRRVDLPEAKVSQDLSAILAIDISGSMADPLPKGGGSRIDQIRAAAGVFFEKLPARAETGLILFNHEMVLKDPLTRDRSLLKQHILSAQPSGGTAYIDATIEGVKMLSGSPANKVIIVMTDGVDLNSNASLHDAITTAKAAGVRVYTVGIGEPGRQEKMTSVLVLDKSGSMRETADDQDRVSKIDALKKAGNLFMSFIREVKPPIARTTVLEFSDTPGVPGPFTNDRRKLRSLVNGLQPSGETALFDATYEAICALEAERPVGKRAVVALTDGIDNTSRRRVDEVIARAREAKVPLYMLGFGRPGELDQSVMERMANETGGQYYHAKNQKSLLDIFEKLSNRLHDDGIDEQSLKQLARDTGGQYFHARDVSKMQLIVEQVVQAIQPKEYTVTFPSLVQAASGTRRDVTLSLVKLTGEVVGASGPGSSSGGYQELGSVQGGYVVHGLVIPEVNHFVYLGLLGLIGALIALPAGLRRMTRSQS